MRRRGLLPTIGDQGYVVGYPVGALGALRSALLSYIPDAMFFVVASTAILFTIASPWRWSWISLTHCPVLCLVVVTMARGYARDVRDRFGVRVVPRFERPLRESPSTYFEGKHIARNLEALDRLAVAVGIPTLGSFGLVEAGRGGSDGRWWDAADLAGVIARLLPLVEHEPSPDAANAGPYRDVPETARVVLVDRSKLAQELVLVRDAALHAAEEEIRLRLVVTSGTSTALYPQQWTELRAQGYC